MPSFYVPQLSLTDKTVTISGEEYHHAIKVRRLAEGENISLTNGSGLVATGSINSISKRDFIVEIETINRIEGSKPHIAVGFSLLKSKHDHMIVEKLTELGIKEFFPVITDRSVRLSGKNYLEKFEKVAVAAIKQCDNAYLPRLNPALKFQDLVNHLLDNGYEPVVALEVGENRQIHTVLDEIKDNNICFIIGPEGGFSEEEVDFIKAKNIKTLTLGNHILRAETAAITAGAVILNYYLMQDSNYY